MKNVSLIHRVDAPFMLTYTPPPSLPRQFTNRVFPLISVVCSLVRFAYITPPLLSLEILLNVEESMVKFPFPVKRMRGEEEREREMRERLLRVNEPFVMERREEERDSFMLDAPLNAMLERDTHTSPSLLTKNPEYTLTSISLILIEIFPFLLFTSFGMVNPSPSSVIFVSFSPLLPLISIA